MNKAQKAVFEIQKEMYADKNIIERSATNPFYKSKYTTLNSYLWALTPKLHKRDCMIHYESVPSTDRQVQVFCVVTHESGDEFRVPASMPLDELNPQEGGKANTYGRRYSTSNAFSIPDEDDDGEGAMKRTKPAKSIEKKKELDPYEWLADETKLKVGHIKQILTKKGYPDAAAVIALTGKEALRLLGGKDESK